MLRPPLVETAEREVPMSHRDSTVRAGREIARLVHSCLGPYRAGFRTSCVVLCAVGAARGVHRGPAIITFWERVGQ